jgi:hypothetical protein
MSVSITLGAADEQIATEPDWADERERPPLLLAAAALKSRSDGSGRRGEGQGAHRTCFNRQTFM